MPGCPRSPQPSKEEVDWDAWLGPCPWRPYNSTYVKRWVARSLRFPHELHRRMGRAHLRPVAGRDRCAQRLRRSSISYVKNSSGDGMVTKFANGVQMVLSRGDKYWHGSCGMRFEGTDGWVAVADSYKEPEVSSPGLLEDGKKLLADYMDRTQRPMNHVRQFLRLRQVAADRGGQPRRHAPHDEHGPRRQYLHVAEARFEVRPGEGGIHQRSRGQPLPHPSRSASRGSIDFLPPSARSTRDDENVAVPGLRGRAVRSGQLLRRWPPGRPTPGARSAGQADRGVEIRRAAQGEGGRVPRAGAHWRQERRAYPGRAARATRSSRTWRATAWSRSRIRPSTTRLREALAKLKGRPLVGVIGSLGVRRDAKAVGPLSGLLKDSDPLVAQAAARSLGRIGNQAAAQGDRSRVGGCTGGEPDRAGRGLVPLL